MIDCWSENVPEEETWLRAEFRASMSCWVLAAVKAFRQVGVGVTPDGQVAAVAGGFAVLIVAPEPPCAITFERPMLMAEAKAMNIVSAPWRKSAVLPLRP